MCKKELKVNTGKYMKSQHTRLTKINLLFIIIFLLSSIIGVHPILTQFIVKQKIDSYDQKAILHLKGNFKKLILSDKAEILKMTHALLKNFKPSRGLESEYSQKKKWSREFNNVGPHLYKDHGLLAVKTYSSGKLILSYEAKHNNNINSQIKYYLENKDFIKKTCHIIYTQDQEPLILFVHNNNNRSEFQHVFVLSFESIFKKFKSLHPNIISFKINNAPLSFFQTDHLFSLIKLGPNLYMNNLKEKMMVKDIIFKDEVFNQNISIKILLNITHLKHEFKKSRFYDLMLILLILLFLIPTILFFIFYHISTLKLILKSIKLATNPIDSVFKKKEIGKFASPLNYIQNQVNHNRYLLNSIMNAQHNHFFYFDKNGRIGVEMSESSRLLLNHFDHTPSIYELFGKFGNINIEKLKNVTDLIWGSGELIEFEHLLSGFPQALAHPNGKTMTIKYSPIKNNSNKLVGISVFCFYK